MVLYTNVKKNCIRLGIFALILIGFISLARGEKLDISICTGKTKSIPLQNTTFLKSYRFLVFTKINGAWLTKDGGYIVSGTTDPNIMFVPPDGFVAKLDKQGAIQWLKFLKTKNFPGNTLLNPLGDEDVQSIIELKNGGYLMASKVYGFITELEINSDNLELNKIMFTKLDENGNMVWNKSFTMFVEDAKNSLLETDDNGFLFYTNIVDLPPDKRGEDPDVYQDMPYASFKVFKFDQNGDLQWSKNFKQFISRKNDSYLMRTSDGGYALTGNLAETNKGKEKPYNFDTYPALLKFDKNFNFKWAKSLEGLPLEMATAIPKTGGGFEIGWKKVRQAASAVHGLIQTQDKGYLVLGNLAPSLSLMTDIPDLKAGKLKNYLIGFKFDSSGNLEWVKKIILNVDELNSPMTNFSVVLTADNQIMIAGPITSAEAGYKEKLQSVMDEQKSYIEKYGEAELSKNENEKSEQSQQDWAKFQEAIASATNASHGSVLVMKTDQEMNISWMKVIQPPGAGPLVNHVMRATSDSGAIIGGEYATDVVESVELGNTTYYKDGFLAKLDASGNVKNNSGWVANYNKQITTEIMTQYSVSNSLKTKASSYSSGLTEREPKFSFYKDAKTVVYAPFASSAFTRCPVSPKISVSDGSLQNSAGSSTSAAQKTWPQIDFERTTTVEPVNEKSRTIHNELLPILNQLYHNQVKLKDNMGGSMLSYVFGEVVANEHVTAVKNYLEGLGYKTQDERPNELTMYKPGYFLVITFSINHPDKAFMTVTY